MSISICNHCGQSLIAILEKSLINQGLSLSIPDPIDAEIINGTKCEKCGTFMEPYAFRDNRRYVLYAICPKCQHFEEV